MQTASPRWCLELLALDFTEHFQGEAQPLGNEVQASAPACTEDQPWGRMHPVEISITHEARQDVGAVGRHCQRPEQGGWRPGVALDDVWPGGTRASSVCASSSGSECSQAAPLHPTTFLSSLSPRLRDYFSLQLGFCSRPVLLISCREVAIEKILKSKPDSAISLVKMT